MVLQYEMSWAACLAPARRNRRRRWLTVGLVDAHIADTPCLNIYIYIYMYIYIYIEREGERTSKDLPGPVT